MKFNKGALILTIFGSIGVAGTAILAARATPKAVEQIKSDSRDNHDGDPYAYTPKEAVQSSWKFYIPAVSVGAATVSCIICANLLDRKNQASLASAYALASESYKRYQKAVKKVYGESGHQKVMREMHIEKAEHNTIVTTGAYGSGSELDIPDTAFSDTPRTFYEPYSNRYFESTLARVIEAEYHVNRNLCLGIPISLNDFFNFLGIDEVSGGDNVGWSLCDEYYWIDFDHSITNLDDGMEIVTIDMVYSPSADF